MKESDVEKVFANYGNVEECIILRDNNGQSKGLLKDFLMQDFLSF